jgi:hypothetical protein
MNINLKLQKIISMMKINNQILQTIIEAADKKNKKFNLNKVKYKLSKEVHINHIPLGTIMEMQEIFKSL